jgi:DUF4097 and DUF4098 domain-containing protein YvlB
LEEKQMAERGYTQTISTAEFTETPRLMLEQPTGDVRIEGWDKQEIEVSVSDSEGMFELEQQGSQVLIRNRPGKFKMVNFPERAVGELENFGINLERVASKVERKVERSMRRLGRGINLNIDLGSWAGSRDYVVKVPHNCDLILRTSSGDLTIIGVTGTLFIQSTSGDMDLNDLGGNVLVHSASGDIDIEGLEGKLGVRTASGDVHVENGNLNEVSASTASGDIQLELVRLPERECEVKTVSGDLQLGLPADAKVMVEVSTLSGDITCGYPRAQVQYSSRSGRNTTLSINGGGPTAHVSSVSGDITIRPVDEEHVGRGHTVDLSREDGDINEPEGYVDRRQSELDILQALERGEITSQEAMRRLGDL